MRVTRSQCSIERIYEKDFYASDVRGKSAAEHLFNSDKNF